MTERFKNPTDLVLEAVPEEHRAAVGLYQNFIMNTSPGWRPSDAARRAVREYERLGIHAFNTMRYSEHTDALAACASSGCSACAESLARREEVTN